MSRQVLPDGEERKRGCPLSAAERAARGEGDRGGCAGDVARAADPTAASATEMNEWRAFHVLYILSQL